MKFKEKLSVKNAVLLAVFTFMLGIGVQSLMARSETTWGLLYQTLGIVRSQFYEKDIKDEDLIYGSIKGLLKALDDPYTRFIDPKGFEEMKIRLQGNFAGVGIQIGIKDQQLTVIAPIEETPAAKAGIKALDKITAINGKSTEDMSLEEAVSMIRGPRGSTVVLTIVRNKEKPKEYSIKRDNIKLKAIYKKKMIDTKKKVGYIMLSTFENKEAFEEMELALEELGKEGLQGLILDLRNNGGGLLENAIDIASIFIKEGTVVHTVDRYGNKDTYQIKEVPYSWYDKPLVVLINGASASASEILAGALADNQRGVIIGTKSFGKASVQNIRPLSDGSAILVTVAKYLTPNDNNIDKTGITPNIIVEIPTASIEAAMAEDYEYKEEDDPQLQAALKEIKKLIK